MKKIILLISAILLLIIAGCENPPAPEDTPKVTETPLQNTKAECISNSDCIKGGCSGTVCHSKSEQIFTTCEYKAEYDCYRIISCGCISGKCQWQKTDEFENCIKEKSQLGSGVY